MLSAWISFWAVLSLRIILSGAEHVVGLKLSAEKRLIRRLLDQYDAVTPHGRPVLNVSEAVDVRFGLGLIQMELDEREKALSMSLWSKYVWEDDYLQWHPADYGNILSIKLPSKLIWKPDIMLYNTAETDISARDTLATIYYNGTVVWVPHQKLKSSCSIDVTNFPFDRQHCHMWFGSWTYTTADINLTMAFKSGLDLSTFHSDFKDTSLWSIEQSDAERRILPSETAEPNFSVLTYTLTLKRNLVFASYILTLPCVFLACLTLVVFWLPPDRPDRTALAMSIFASFLLLLLILVEAAPPTASSVPSLGIYYCFNMVIIMMAVFLSSLVVNVCQMGNSGQPVPNWLDKLVMQGPVQSICMCRGFLPLGFYPSSPTTAAPPHDDPSRKGSRSYILPSGDSLQPETIPLRDVRHYRPNDAPGSYGVDDAQLLFPMTACDGGSTATIKANGVAPSVVVGNGKTETLRSRPSSDSNHHHHPSSNHRAKSTTTTTMEQPFPDLTSSSPPSRFSSSSTSSSTSAGGGGGGGDAPFMMEMAQLSQSLERMGRSVRQLEEYFYRRLREDRALRYTGKKWKGVAFVLDRIFFLLYVLLIALSIAILFPRPN